MERQTPVYSCLNEFENLKDRKVAAKVLRDAVEGILRNGYDPYDEQSANPTDEKKYNVTEAVQFALSI